MAKRMVTLRVDESILRVFDEWCWEHRVSRTAAVVEMMSKAAGVPVPPPVVKPAKPVVEAPRVQEKPVVVDKPAVIAELKDSISRIQEACPHPREKRQVMSWGAKCGECNAIVK